MPGRTGHVWEPAEVGAMRRVPPVVRRVLSVTGEALQERRRTDQHLPTETADELEDGVLGDAGNRATAVETA